MMFILPRFLLSVAFMYYFVTFESSRLLFCLRLYFTHLPCHKSEPLLTHLPEMSYNSALKSNGLESGLENDQIKPTFGFKFHGFRN